MTEGRKQRMAGERQEGGGGQMVGGEILERGKREINGVETERTESLRMRQWVKETVRRRETVGGIDRRRETVEEGDWNGGL